MLVEIAENDRLCQAAFDIYRASVQKREVLHSREYLSFPIFRKVFFSREEKKRKINLADEEGRAFASGCIDEGTGRSFVTYVGVKEEERRKGIGRSILNRLEERLREEGGCDSVEVSFFNPVTFYWEVPGKPGVVHPNTPGADASSSAWLFLKNCGYRDFAMQNSYYISLEKYQYPADMEERKKKLLEKGYEIAVYDETQHCGMQEMIMGLHNSMWERDILGEPPVSGGGRPILVPVKDGRVCGFTGPLAVEENGRGFFAGIAVDEKHRGNGLAKLLFCALCEELKHMGAGYMTLFTGENNPARNIYEAAGFSIVRVWADMRKDREYGKNK